MEARVLLFLIVLGTSWRCSARVATTDLSPTQSEIASVLQINHHQLEREVQGLCKFCKVLAAPILDNLSNSTNQTELAAALHLLCALTIVMKDECDAMVDYIVPMIFNETSKLTPETLCILLGLCETNVSRQLSENGCEFCHHAVTDPNSQLDIVEMLLKACDSVEGSVKNCKRLVSTNAPWIPIYVQELLKRHDICTLLNACSSATNYATEQGSSSETSMLSAY